MKKLLSFLCAVVLLGSTGYAAGVTDHGDGMYTVSDTMTISLKGENVTLLVAEQDFAWFDQDVWSDGIGTAVAYYGETTITDENQYQFHFSLDQSGRYYAYTTVGGEKTEKTEFTYINSSRCETALEKILTGDPVKIAEALAEPADLGVFDDINQVKVTELLEQAVLPTNTQEEVLALVKKASFIALLSENKITDMGEQLYLLENEPIVSYLTENLYDSVLQGIAGTTDSIAAFDGKLKDSVLLAVVNGNDSAAMQQILTEYKIYLGITQATITAQMCSAIVKGTDFATLGSAVTYINAYTPTTGSGGSAGGGGGGVSAGSSGNAYQNAEIAVEQESEDEKKDEYKVFDDIADVAWAEAAIQGLYYAGIVNGKTTTLFFPHDTVTREEFAKMITLVFSMNLVDDEFPFTDVSPEDWCYPYVKTAYLAGITKGISEDTFGKGENITRQDLCVMAYNALNASDESLPMVHDAISFSDADDIAGYAKDAVIYLQRAGIINGRGDNLFAPDGFATRAEAAKIIYLVMTKK